MYIRTRFYFLLLAVVAVLVCGHWLGALYIVGCVLLALIAASALLDVAMLYAIAEVDARRSLSERFSNGDKNEVTLTISNNSRLPLSLDVADEMPPEFQQRNTIFSLALKPHESKHVIYTLRPTKRGVYNFGKIRAFAHTVIGFVERRFTRGEEAEIKVYPSYMMLNQYELLAIHNDLTELGIKKVRKIANKTDFEHIKEYVTGDDYRTINWKATARRNSLMVNVYQDEKSQQVVNLIDKGRVMQQAFNGMTLLDYAINASLVLSYISIKKEDKAGIITYDKRVDTIVRPDKGPVQMKLIVESLYSQNTTFGETDYSELCVSVRRDITKRSLMVVYTNFLGVNAVNRQLKYLKQLSQHHVVLVVFFDDEELENYERKNPYSVDDYYGHVVAHRMRAEKRLVVSTLKQNGIYSLLTKPENLTVDVINKYLEMKARNQF